ncbi:hypothetical protein KP79_PYT14296 [Mizuhopecten yessoensis]|uniref:Uncharacterized protein n=1 Tax=Mizuhopecten yessoensis TaxID=6573 RepID=A0A210PN92_MIZYE|nr:hypothetical protein KP79_PYT14296 [Mizuhopecten yessoensis]
MEFWLALFDQIKADGKFDGGFLDKNIILFCFLALIQDELDVTAEVWDFHVIRPSTNPCVPSARPNTMFAVPELYAVDSYTCAVDDENLLLCKNNALFRSGIPCDEDGRDIIGMHLLAA